MSNGIFYSTKLTSSSGMIKIKDEDFSKIIDKNIFNIHVFSRILQDYEVFKDLTENSTVKELLEKVEIVFKGNTPKGSLSNYGYTAKDSWNSTYEIIKNLELKNKKT